MKSSLPPVSYWERFRNYVRDNGFWLAVNIAAAIPLVWLAWDFQQGNLSFNPIDDITDRTGKAAIILLLLSLAMTPANIVFGWRKGITVRKALGMFAFVYASFHLLNFVGYDYGFDLQLIWQDGIATKPFIVAGLIAFLIMVPLAITSTRASMRRLGKKWKTLHRIVYVAGIVAVIHFLWLAKAAEDWEPLLYGAILALLLLVRVPPVRSRIIETRRRLLAPQTAAGSKAPPAKRGGEGARPAGSTAVTTGTQQTSSER